MRDTTDAHGLQVRDQMDGDLLSILVQSEGLQCLVNTLALVTLTVLGLDASQVINDYMPDTHGVQLFNLLHDRLDATALGHVCKVQAVKASHVINDIINVIFGVVESLTIPWTILVVVRWQLDTLVDPLTNERPGYLDVRVFCTQDAHALAVLLDQLLDDVPEYLGLTYTSASTVQDTLVRPDTQSQMLHTMLRPAEARLRCTSLEFTF